MATNITLPDPLAARLQQQAEAQHRSVEDIALSILNDALEPAPVFPTVEDVVAKIKATPRNPDSTRPAAGSLADALRKAPSSPDFDLAQWNKDWEAVEAEMRAITHADDVDV